MELNVALKKLLDFCHKELTAKGGTKGWYKIDGERICNECTRHKRRALYIFIQDGSGVFLKCFRASCDLRRFATVEDFKALGFNNDEAIKAILDKSSRTDMRNFSNSKRPIFINDWIPSKEQLEYFRNRTNIVLKNVQDVQKYRIIPSIMSVLRDNLDEDDEQLTTIEYMGVKADKRAITFATENYSTFSYRHIEGKKLIFNIDKETSNNGYTLCRGDDPDAVKTLVVCEGVFDLINVYTKYCILNNAKYVATFGFASFVSDIIYHYKQHILSMENLIIFADSDIKRENSYMYDRNTIMNMLKSVKNTIGDVFKNIIVVYNKSSKDFGDMRLEISPVIEEIKGSKDNI